MTPPEDHPDFPVIDREVVFTSPWMQIRHDRIRTPDGHEAEREIVDRIDAVAGVPLLGDGTVILLRQYRHAFAERHLEIPAGKLDVDGEDPAEAMDRELAEEVGHRAGTVELLVSFANSSGWTNEVTHVYLATDLREAPRPEDFDLEHEEADMEQVRMPLDEAVAAVHAGQITDAKTVIGLLAAADRLRRRG